MTGPLLLPTSALQELPLAAAVRALLRLRPDGLQLCPGNLPSPGMRGLLGGASMHHGFAWEARRVEVWDSAGAPLISLAGRSVHPPDLDDSDTWLEQHADDVVLETMPPGHLLGSGASLERAMDRGARLAVDVSHLHIQWRAGLLSAAVRDRLYDYERVAEIHVSDNDGLHDLHRPPSKASFGAEWARARCEAGVPLVLEAYLHGLDDDARRALVEDWRCN